RARALDAPGGAVHLIVPGGPSQADGRRLAGLFFALEPGWKTYWRAPGPVGLAPFIEDAGSDNLAGLQVLYPAPAAFAEGDTVSLGYAHPVVFPLVLTPQDPARPIRLDLRVDYGVCSIQCVPGQVRLQADVLPFGTRNAEAARLVARAQALVPQRHEDIIDTARFGDGVLSLRLTEGGDAIGPLRLAACEHPGLAIAPLLSPQGRDLVFPARTRRAGPGAARLRLTLVGVSGAIDTEYPLDLGS
ncbi:MAG: hypothetical protein KDI98_06450, partial [Hyphomicrobiaceae bacterium]|nr:hypothetical protein [Hyphomicrobiaceae bacterium]